MFRSFRHEEDENRRKTLREFHREIEMKHEKSAAPWVALMLDFFSFCVLFFLVSVTSICVPWGARQNWLSRAALGLALEGERSVILINYPTCQVWTVGKKWKWDAEKSLNVRFAKNMCCFRASILALDVDLGVIARRTVSAFVCWFRLISLARFDEKFSFLTVFFSCVRSRPSSRSRRRTTTVDIWKGASRKRRRGKNAKEMKTGSWKKSATGILYTHFEN